MRLTPGHIDTVTRAENVSNLLCLEGGGGGGGGYSLSIKIEGGGGWMGGGGGGDA